MSDRPLDQQVPDPGEPVSEGDGGWHQPAEEEQPSALFASEVDVGWHAPTDTGPMTPITEIPPADEAGPPAPVREPGAWHRPMDKAEASVEEAPAASAESYATTAGQPGDWHRPEERPPAGAVGAPEEADEAEGWHAPVQARAAGLLDGVADTVYPLPAQEAAPVDEETTIVPRAEVEALATEDEATLVLDETPAEEVEQAEVAAADLVGDDAFAEGTSPAEVAAAMLARLDAETEAAETVEAITEAEPAVEEPPVQEADSGLVRLIAQFDNVEDEVGALRAGYERGEMSREALQEALRKLMILDTQGNWWMIGVESDMWYRYEDGQWVPTERPRLAAAQVPTITDVMPVAGAPAAGEDIPFLQRVPQVDPEATMVGAAASRFDETPLDYQPTGAATVYGATVAGATLAGATVPGAAAQAVPGGPTQPDYEAQLDQALPSDLVRRAQEQQAHQAQRWIVRALVIGMIGILGIAFVVIVGAILFYVNRVSMYSDRIEALRDLAGQFQTTTIYDANGQELSQIIDPTGGDRRNVALPEISPFMIHATIATENERFYLDPGWDLIAIIRAAYENIQAGEIVAGGASTITQQLARALVLEPERRAEISISRKIDEAIIAAEIGRRYTKDEILQLYLNEIYYGNLAYGVEAAARTYFDVSAADLNLPQAAFLVGLVGAPATYDPVTNREAAFTRMDAVINFMLNVDSGSGRGCIQFEHPPYVNEGPFCVTPQMVDDAVIQRAEVEIREYSFPDFAPRYPHFVNFVAQQLEENYGLADIYRSGFNVYTTINPAIQQAAEQAVTDQLAFMQARRIGGNNASVVVMDPRNGAILAMVGSADYNNDDIDGQVNVAFSMQQPGSSIKPLVYVTAFQNNPQGQYWTPATIVWDTPTCWGTYCPTNYDNRYHGPQPVRIALASSYNIPAVKTMEYVTPERFAQTAQAMGLTFPGSTPQQAGLPGAIGAFDVRLYDMVVAYGVFANSGQRVTPYAITGITDNNGNEIQLPPRPEPVQVIQPEHAYLINSILSDDVARGPAFGRGTYLNIPNHTAAVKTGTTNDNRDNWAIGYTPSVVVGVWHGNTDNSPMAGTSGFIAAAPIWNAVMTAALAGQPPQEFPRPAGITVIEVCGDSGTLPAERCPPEQRRREIFVQVQPPPGIEQDLLRPVRVDTLSGRLANEFCPNFVEEQFFLNIQDRTAFDWINGYGAGQAWAAERGIALPASPPPTEACDPSMPQPIIALDQPLPQAQVDGLVEVRGRVAVFDFASYELLYGVGDAPEEFQRVDGPYAVQHQASELLGGWDVSGLPDGTYTLRLHVENRTGGYANIDHVVRVIHAQVTITATPFTPMVITQTPVIITLTPSPTWTPLAPTTPPPQAPTMIPPTLPTATPAPPTITPFVITATPLVPATAVPVSSALPPHDPVLDIPIQYGAFTTGIITNDQLALYYRFNGQAGDQIEVAASATSGNLDTLVYLMDTNGQIIAMDDDGANVGTDSLLVFTLPQSGPHTIVVTRFDVTAGLTTGEFTMTLNRLN